MDTRLLQFAELLFRRDKAALAAVRQALEEPIEFVARHKENLGYVRPKPGWAPAPWELLIDVAQLQGWLWEVDWKADSEEVVAAVRDLAPAGALKIDWDGMASEHVQSETREFLRVLSDALAPSGETMVCLDRGRDSYPLALLPTAMTGEAQRLAAEIGGSVELMNT